LPWLLKLALRAADGFIVHSKSDGNILQEIFPQAHIEVTPLPTYADLAESVGAQLQVTLPTDRPILLFAGFVRPYKGLDILLDALSHVLAEMPVHLLVAGEFWQGCEDYRRQIDKLGINEAVTIVDEYLPNETLASCIQRADVVVLPYRSATQSALIQLAFGLGTPVITTDVGGLAEAVEDGRTGLVVPPEDSKELAVAIIRFCKMRMGSRFRETIVKEQHLFDWAHLINKIEVSLNL
jgi:glycosyltransferase involved in cell wall biosynthesis